MKTPAPSSLFLRAASHSLDLEGGLVDNKSDKGGKTNFGISDARDGKKDGLIDLDNDGKGDIPPENLTKEQALDIYHQEYWLPCHGDELPPSIAIFLFDTAIHFSVEKATKLLQRKLNVFADGKIGHITIKAINAKNQNELLINLLTERAYLYHAIVKADSSQAIFLEGWFARLFRLSNFIQSISQPPPITT
jgi:lysozyme family protein